MPKETVYGEDVPALTSDGEPKRAVVDVQWHRDQAYVQVATHVYDQKPLVVRGTREELEAARLVMTESIGPPDAGSSTGVNADLAVTLDGARTGFFVQLDRQGINQLIRNLRRARDQAFGRDE